MKLIKDLSIYLLVMSLAFSLSNLSCMKLSRPQYYRELSGEQKTQVEDWLHSGDLLYQIGDYELALDYYKKIIEYYPGTRYAQEANGKIKEIKKSEQKLESK